MVFSHPQHRSPILSSSNFQTMKTHQYACSLSFFLLFSVLVVRPCVGEERAIYLVLMDGEAVAFQQGLTSPEQHNQFDPEREIWQKHARKLMHSHDRLLQSTLELGSYRKLHSFHHIINGFAIHTTPSQAKKLEVAPGVIRIEKDMGVTLLTSYTPEFLGVPEHIWNRQGGAEHAGEGLVIGVVDTGIDPTHPSFAYEPIQQNRTGVDTNFTGGPCQLGPQFPTGSCNGKIVSARYFSAGAEAVLPINASRDLSPFDEIGHGSHVASIAAGNWGVPVVVDGLLYGFASGMAPRAKLAIYKALYPQGGTLADLVSAIDQAAQDRVDVITLSVGPDRPPQTLVTFINIFDLVLLFARRAGIFVAQAAGNKGPTEATVVSYSPWVIGVAAGTIDRSYIGTLVTGDGRALPGIGLSAPTPGDGLFKFKLVSATDAAIMSRIYAEECQHPDALQPAVVLNSIIICTFSQGFLNGTSDITAILRTARVLGFVGFILVANPLYGDFIAQPLPFPIPGIMIPRVADAQILLDYYEKHTYRDRRGIAISYGASAAIREGRVANFTDQAPRVSRFSSRGPDIIDNQMNPADVLKPDILSPGQQIWGAWSPASMLDPILSGNNFALLSGTSMATPHVAGIAALLKQFHPSWTPSMIASAMSTTAIKHDNKGLPIMSYGPEPYSLYPSTPFDYGAGFINPSAVLDPGLVLSADFQDYLSFLCSLPKLNPPLVQSFTGLVCIRSLDSPADLNLPSITISALRRNQTVRRMLTNVAGKPETYLISVLPPEGVMVNVNPAWFNIAPEGKQEVNISFTVSRAKNSFSFGEIVLTGSLNHIVRLPLAILPMA